MEIRDHFSPKSRAKPESKFQVLQDSTTVDLTSVLISVCLVLSGISIYFFRANNLLSFSSQTTNFIVENGPSFFHASGFVLLQLSLCSCKKCIALACSFWAILNVMLEFQQGSIISLPIINRFYAGTFDIKDLYAIFAGVLVGFVLSKFLKERKGLN